MAFIFRSKKNKTQIKSSAFEAPSPFYAFAVLAISLLPFLVTMLDIDFVPASDLDTLRKQVSSRTSDAIFTQLTGLFSHTLLGWSAFCTALFTAILALTHFRVKKEVSIPIIAVALLSAGTMDAFNVLVADRLIETTVDSKDLAPFVWTLSRFLNASLMIGALVLLLYYPKKDLAKKNSKFVVLTSLVFVAITYGTIRWSLYTPTLPQIYFPSAFITYPYDILPVILFLGLGVFIYYSFYKREPNFFSYALLLSLIPEVAAEIYMAFGFSNHLDAYFNMVYSLNILGYLLPFIGLCLESIARHEKSQTVQQELSLVNQRLDLALSQAQIATKAKSTFLASMTHELRTPMNGVIGMANLLSETKLDQEQSQQVNIIKSCATSLLTVINDILDFSKIEAGKMEIESVPFNIKKVCKETVELVRFQAEGKDLALELEFHEAVPYYVEGDPNRLRQVLLNFLSNAIKFTMKGHIKLVLSCPEQPSENQNKSICIRFAVEDTGVGIPGNVADDLFVPFSQGDSSTSRKFGGTGLGLTISRKLASLMGGKVWLESIEGKGSTFYLEASLKQADQSEVENLERKEQGAQEVLERRNLQILLAEDNQVNQMVALSILKKIGYKADVADNGLEVLEALDKKNYDLIFMDMMMPEMDGLEATKEVCKRFKKPRADGVKRPRIIAMTANAMAEDRDRCLKAGMDDFMSKPIILNELKDMILSTPKITSNPVESMVEVLAEPKNPYEELSQGSSVISAAMGVKGTRFEPQKVLEFFEEDQDMIPDMIDLFLKTSLEYMGHIKGAIESQNAFDLQLHSHTLKGSAKVFYANRAIEISQALEDLGKNKSFDTAQMLYDDLEKELPLLEQELKEFKEKLA